MAQYTSFFDKFPKVKYDIDRNSNYSTRETITNIFFRIGAIRETMDNAKVYDYYDIEDGDTPESLAEKFYGDAGAGWIILMSNYRMDPQFDWPLEYLQFLEYIKSKYGSVSASKAAIHHHEKVITRTDNFGNKTIERLVVGSETITQTDESYNIDGKTVHENIEGNVVYCYDYENDLNESKRRIKVIKPEYYRDIMIEFNKFTGLATGKPEFARGVV